MVAALAVAAGGVLAPAGGAAAQPQPTMVLSPASGPCDGMVEVTGSGFLGQTSLRFYLVQPGTADISADFLNFTYVNGGTFRQLVWLQKRSCDAAALDSRSEQPTGHLTFAFTAAFTEEEFPLQPGDRIPNITAVAQYAYTTTTTLKPQPTLVLSPSSGPCDGTIEVKGSNFLDQPSLRLYVVKPGTADISMGLLNSGVRIQNASFSEVVGLYHGGCEAAALDSQAEQPTGNLSIAGSFTFQADTEPGERIPNIVAVAQYAYTTTVAQPQPTLVLSPSSGPCDGTVEVTATHFPPDHDTSFALRLPDSEDLVGTLRSAVTDARGEFAVRVTLGELGCRAAQIYMRFRDPTHPQLEIVADPIQIGASLATVLYTFTTTEVGGGEVPRALPNTGGGPGDPPVSPVWLAVAGLVAGVGLLLVVVSLYRKRQQS